MITLDPIAPDQAHVLRNLFELYCHDFSEQLPLELGADGRFNHPLDDAWWASDDHFPFFVRNAERLVGFALVRRGSRVGGAPEVMDVAELFIVRSARRRGAGLLATRALFSRFPAVWEIRVRQSNIDAHRFWTRVGHDWLGRSELWEPFVADGVAWSLLRVDSRVSHERA